MGIRGRTVVVVGKWLKTASIHDEEWMEGNVIGDPGLFLAELKEQGLKADLFTFVQKIPETRPNYTYPMEWDNVAAIPIASFDDWWERRLPQVTRKNVRRANKRGVVVKTVEFNDDFVRSLLGIFNETLIKQGRPFAHHGKDFDTVKKEHGTMLDRSQFLGAYSGEELIGFIKLVYMGPIASILNIVTKDQHYDKRPTNALIAKAVEICAQKGISHLIYGKYTYGNKTDSSLREFKHRNGFEEIRFPRYYVPLTLKGRVAVRLKLHRGLLGILPASVIALLLKLRSRALQLISPMLPPPAHGEASWEKAQAREPEGENA
jgi:hypothetical protein